MKKKSVVTITIQVELSLNKEHSYQAATRLEGELHSHVNMGMFCGYHPEDADVTNVDISSVVEDFD